MPRKTETRIEGWVALDKRTGALMDYWLYMSAADAIVCNSSRRAMVPRKATLIIHPPKPRRKRDAQ
jgi:hypothetical protein